MDASDYYLIVPSIFGAFSILWRESGGKSKIFRIILSENINSASELIQNNFSAACQSSNPTILHLANLMQSFLSGQLVKFDLNLLAFETCSNFQQRVLLAENNIPRGWVSTYYPNYSLKKYRLEFHLDRKRASSFLVELFSFYLLSYL